MPVGWWQATQVPLVKAAWPRFIVSASGAATAAAARKQRAKDLREVMVDRWQVEVRVIGKTSKAKSSSRPDGGGN
jgi:hypothetical protein